MEDVPYVGVRPLTSTSTTSCPLRLGGTDELDNLQPVCRSCNIRKSDRHPQELASFQEEALRGYEFERIVADVLSNAGFGVLTEATGPDGGVDIVARRRDDKTGRRIGLLVECKYCMRPLTVNEVAEFAANLAQLPLRLRRYRVQPKTNQSSQGTRSQCRHSNTSA